MHKAAFILLIIGGLNWLLEAFSYGVGRWLPSGVSMVLYIVIGLAAIYEIVTHKKNCRDCTTAGTSM